MRKKLKLTKLKYISLMLAFTLVFTGVFSMISYGAYNEEKEPKLANEEVTVNEGISALAKPVNIPGVTWGISDIGNPRADVSVLEVVPYKGMGQIGYLVGGSEPYRNWKEILEGLDTIDQKRNYYQQLCTQIRSVAGDAIELPPNYTSPEKLVRTASEMASDISKGGVDLKKWIYVEKAKKKEINSSNIVYKLKKVQAGNGEYSREVIKDSEGEVIDLIYKVDNKNGEYKVLSSAQGAVDSLDAQFNSNEFNAVVYDIQIDNSYYYYDGLKNKEWFKKHTLRLADSELDGTIVKVYTITPEELNNNNKILEEVDLVYFSAGAETGVDNTGYVPIYEHLCTLEDAQAYTTEDVGNVGQYTTALNGSFSQKSGATLPSYKGENDINWSTVKSVYLKAAIESSISIVFNTQIYNNAGVISSDGNVFKLYMMVHVFDREKFYEEYLKSNTDGKFEGHSTWNSGILSSWLTSGTDAILGNAHHVVENIYVMDGSENFGRNFITDNKGNGSDKYFKNVRDYLSNKYGEHKNQVSTADILSYLLSYLQGKPPVVKFVGSDVFPNGTDKYFMYVYSDVNGTDSAVQDILYEIYDKTTFNGEMKITFEYNTAHAIDSCSSCQEIKTQLRTSLNSIGKSGVTSHASSNPMYITIDNFSARKVNNVFANKFGCPMSYFNGSHSGVQNVEYTIKAEKVVDGIVRSHQATLTIIPITLFNLD